MFVLLDLKYIGKVNKRNKKKKKKNIIVNSLCVIGSCDVYVIDYKNKLIVCFFLLGLIFIVFSLVLLEFGGIC